MSEGIDVSKTTDSCKSNICCYWYFLKINFRFQPKIFDDCHDLTHKAVGFNDITTFSRKGMIIELIFGIKIFFCLVQKMGKKIITFLQYWNWKTEIHHRKNLILLDWFRFW